MALRICTLTLCLLALSAAPASCDEITDHIRSGYEALATAMQAGDYAAIVEATHPRLLQLMGGRENMAQILETEVARLAMQGYRIERREIVAISAPVKGYAALYAVIKTRVELSTPEGPVRQGTYSLAISEDKGRTWKYLDAGEMDEAQLRMILPGLPSTFKLSTRAEAEPKKN